MSMITELIEKLKDVSNTMQKIGMNRQSSVIVDAYRTIEELSAKLHTVNMEQSNQYYHGGWIPVSERLPEERESMFAKFKGTDKWINAMFEKISDDVLVTVEFNDGSRRTEVSHTIDSEWKFNISTLQRKVIAWQPLLKPYSSNEEECK